MSCILSFSTPGRMRGSAQNSSTSCVSRPGDAADDGASDGAAIHGHFLVVERGALDGHRLEAVENGAGGTVRFGRKNFHGVKGKKKAVKKDVTASDNEKRG